MVVTTISIPPRRFSARVNEIAYEDIALIERKVDDLGRRNALGRMAQLIIELQQRLSARGLCSDNEFEFPISQQHLADALGLTTVYVNRTLKRLRDSGIIRFERGRMAVDQMSKLRTIAEEC